MNRYPSDEELNYFIKELEKQELYAPRHLKEDILKKAAKPGQEGIQVHEPYFQGKKRKNSRAVQIFPYSLKVIAGMAAAILLLFTVPIQDMSAGDIIMEQEQQEEKLMQEMKKEALQHEKNLKSGFSFKLDQGSKLVNEKSNEILSILNNLFKMNGGNQNES